MEISPDHDASSQVLELDDTTLESALVATLVSEAYKLYLGREAKLEEINYWRRAMKNGLSPAEFLNSVINSEESRLNCEKVKAETMHLVEEPRDQDFATLVAGVYRGFLGRSASPEELEFWAASGVPFVDIVREIRDSEEAACERSGGTDRPDLDTNWAKFAVELMYRLHLGRYPNEPECEAWTAALTAGKGLDSCAAEIEASREAKAFRMRRQKPNDESTGQLVLKAYDAVLNRSPTLQELEANDRAFRLGKTVDMLIMELLRARDDEGSASLPRSLPLQVDLMGTTKTINRATWRRAIDAASAISKATPSAATRRPFAFSMGNNVTVSVIVSIYKGRSYVERFLHNLIDQTIFRSNCEVIVIDAASPEGEAELINPFLERHSNIRYIRTSDRITIYNAWNIAIEESQGIYITNMNLDDLRAPASLEIQAATLDSLPFVDVVYQDFFYSFDRDADFDTIAKAGLKSQLPPVSTTTLFAFNSPHHAPMWRRSLHKDVGLFDETLVSAGDYDFWLRCLQAGKTFFKLDEAHTSYFVNPDGVSSRGDPQVAREIEKVKARHALSLLSPALLESFDVFGSHCYALGAAPVDPSASRFQLIQNNLCALRAGGLKTRVDL